MEPVDGIAVLAVRSNLVMDEFLGDVPRPFPAGAVLASSAISTT